MKRSALVAAVSILALLGSGVSQAAPITLQSVGPFPSGPGSDFRTGDLAVVDLDEDGNPDIAVSNFGPSSQPPFGNTSVLWGNGTGSFSAPTDWRDGITNGVVVADLDRDGHPDLITWSGGGVLVLWGNRTRMPQDQQVLGTAFTGTVAVADVDGDGDIDVVATEQSDNRVEVFYNDGARAFHSTRFAAGPGATGIAIGELDGVHGPDLVVTGFWTSAVTFLFNDGLGGFGTPLVISNAGMMPAGIGIGEFTGDSHTDVVYARQGCFVDAETTCPNDGITVLAGDGMGAFSHWVDLDAGEGPSGVAVADLNGDGRHDVVATNYNSNNVSIFLGRAGGGFDSFAPISVDRGPSGVAVADVNHDGCRDVLTANWRSASVSVLLVSGCTPLPSVTPATTPTATPTATPTLKANGVPCLLGTECRSGSCSDRVCCDRACDAENEFCGLPGFEGTCVAVALPTNTPTPTVTPNLTPQPNGVHCVFDQECVSTFCTSGVCCEVRCEAASESCAVPGFEGKCLQLLPTTTPTPTAKATVTRTPTPSATVNPTFVACTGNCDASPEVTVDELIIGVNIALGVLPLSACDAFDSNRDGQVTIDELLLAVNNALYGCGVLPPTPRPTGTPTATATRTATAKATPPATFTPTAPATPKGTATTSPTAVAPTLPPTATPGQTGACPFTFNDNVSAHGSCLFRGTYSPVCSFQNGVGGEFTTAYSPGEVGVLLLFDQNGSEPIIVLGTITDAHTASVIAWAPYSDPANVHLASGAIVLSGDKQTLSVAFSPVAFTIGGCPVGSVTMTFLNIVP